LLFIGSALLTLCIPAPAALSISLPVVEQFSAISQHIGCRTDRVSKSIAAVPAFNLTVAVADTEMLYYPAPAATPVE
jgi:hypothetical protein